jgi:shikimate kinase|tara:strand:+ start:497 stop:997 length:501 start_codon:yes stop_codon:yes gene_type:complete
LVKVLDNISFIGMAGSGKSTLGKALSEILSTSFVDTDLLIEDKFMQSLEELKQSKGYKFVRLAEEGIILNLQNDIKVISTGGSAIYSDKAISYLNSFSKIVYISTPLDVIKSRIGVGQERGLAVAEGTTIEDTYSERKPLYEKWAQLTLDGTKPINDLVKDIIRGL